MRGRSLFAGNCAACHGASGEGQPDWRISKPNGTLSAFGDCLDHQEIIAVLTFVKTLWGDKARGGFSILKPQAIISQRDPCPAG